MLWNYACKITNLHNPQFDIKITKDILYKVEILIKWFLTEV